MATDVLNLVLLIVGAILLIVGLFTTFVQWDLLKGIIEIVVGIILIGVSNRSRIAI